MSRHLPIAVLYCLILQAATVNGQDTPPDRLLNSDPQQLLDLSQDGGKGILITTIADFESRDVREAPANVVVITSRQLEASGARTLYEALQLVPGISFGRDVDDVIGISIHGNWAEEGKCLFMLDGRQLNENDFGTYHIGERIPLANVDRIEVIMGPGSVLHGGYAALGVINIVTRGSDHGTGTRATFQTGYSENDLTRTMTNISGAHRLSRDQEIGYTTSHVRGRRSNAIRLLPDSTLLNFADNTEMQASTFQFNYRWRNFKATMMYMQENFAVSDGSYSVELRDVIFGLEYKTKIHRKVDVNWSLNHADQLPWYYVNTSEPERLSTNSNNRRTSAIATLSYKPATWFTGRLGVSGYQQVSKFYQRNEASTFSMNGERSISVVNGALYGEVSLHGKPGILSGGYRLESNSLTGNFLAPRIAYSKIIGLFHVKAMWSKAFKAPTIMNLNYGTGEQPIQAEYVTTAEAEVGVKLGKMATLTTNVYDTKLDNPIVYVLGDGALDGYVNRNRAGTQGVDVRLNWETKRTTVLLSYGLNRQQANNDLPETQLPDSISGMAQGLPSQRGTVVLAWDLSPSFTVRTRLDWRSKTVSYQYVDRSSNELSLVAWPSEFPINAGFTFRPNGSTRFAIDMACRNILDAQRTVLSPYRIGTTPFALNGREWTVGITYKFVQ